MLRRMSKLVLLCLNCKSHVLERRNRISFRALVLRRIREIAENCTRK